MLHQLITKRNFKKRKTIEYMYTSCWVNLKLKYSILLVSPSFTVYSNLRWSFTFLQNQFDCC